MSPTAITSPHVVCHAVEGHPVPPTDANTDFGAQLDVDVNPDVDSPLAPPVDEGNVVDMNDFSSLSVNEVQKLFDKEIHDYTNPWKGSIKLLVCLVTEEEAKRGQ